jgi:hypothetical protein
VLNRHTLQLAILFFGLVMVELLWVAATVGALAAVV